MRTKKFKATITDQGFFEDMIWMSYRYCIGRKTIAAHMHAGNIAKNCYNFLSDDRKSFNAQDIRKEINDVLRWRDNISINIYGCDLNMDAFSLIIQRLINKYGEDLPGAFNWDDVMFDIDDTGKVSMSEFKGNKPIESIPILFSDLIPWIKLANALDIKNHKVITTVFNGQKEEHECFQYPTMDYTGKNLRMRWVDINSYLNNPFIDTYIDEQYITEIQADE